MARAFLRYFEIEVETIVMRLLHMAGTWRYEDVDVPAKRSHVHDDLETIHMTVTVVYLSLITDAGSMVASSIRNYLKLYHTCLILVY